jgi:hypothetical protein
MNTHCRYVWIPANSLHIVQLESSSSLVVDTVHSSRRRRSSASRFLSNAVGGSWGMFHTTSKTRTREVHLYKLTGEAGSLSMYPYVCCLWGEETSSPEMVAVEGTTVKVLLLYVSAGEIACHMTLMGVASE